MQVMLMKFVDKMLLLISKPKIAHCKRILYDMKSGNFKLIHAFVTYNGLCTSKIKRSNVPP